MEFLTETQKAYIEQWNNTENGFNEVLYNITNEDLKAISKFVELNKSRVWWNCEVRIYFCVMNRIKNDEHFEILLEVDEKGLLEVSEDHNKKLVDAIKTKNRNLIKLLVNHKQFSYPGTGSYNEYYYKWYNLTPMNSLINEANFLEYLDTIQYLYSIMNENDKSILIADLFCAININQKYSLVESCFNLFKSS